MKVDIFNTNKKYSIIYADPLARQTVDGWDCWGNEV
jgi:N6-adenosine-specific RNA methylase IME4